MYSTTSFRSALSFLFLLSFSALIAQGPSPIAYYPMSGGNLQDFSGNGNHGSGFNVNPTADQNGIPGEAYLLNGNNGYIEYQDNANFNPSLPVTITAWVRKDNVGQGAKFMVFTNRFKANTYDGVWININAADKVTAAFGDGGPVGPGSRRSKTGITPLSQKTWHHVAVVINGPLDMEVYLDGINDCGDYSGTGSSLSTTTSFNGASGVSDLSAAQGPFNYGKGAINDIRFFDHALTQLEIWQIAFGNSNLPSIVANCPPHPCDNISINALFTSSTSSSVATFHDQTTSTLTSPPSYLLWDFGDGSTLTTAGGANFSHNYNTPGVYQVCMTAVYLVENEECSETYCKNISASNNDLRTQSGGLTDKGKEQESWTLYPNPAKSVLNLEVNPTEGKYQVDILDLNGKRLESHQGLGATQLSLNHLSSGMYLVSLHINGIQSIKKLIVR